MEIPVFNTYIDPGAHAEVGKVLQSTFLSEGEVVRQFENELKNTFGWQHCITVNSGTSALHLALVQAGVKEGDEVILPAQTFVATGLAILYLKAVPVFADIDYGTGNISADSVKKKITSRTKAILPVHWAGYPCDLDEINLMAKEHNLVVIEDAAHALGAMYKSKSIGSISHYTCFSFQSIKHLTTGDGGAITTMDENAAEGLTAGRWFGIHRSQAKMTELGERSYDLSTLGYKYHLNNYGAALGLANLKNFEQRMQHRNSIAEYYLNQLSDVAGIRLFDRNPDRRSAWWLFGMHVEKRGNFIRSLKEKGIASSVVHQRIDRNSIFGKKADLPHQEKFDETQIHIPIHDGIDSEKAEYIVNAIRMGW